MQSLFGHKGRRLGAALALAGVFSAAVGAFAQDGSLHGLNGLASPQGGTYTSALPDMTSHPAAGRTVQIRVCTEDGLSHRSCDLAEVTLPLPQLINPVGYAVQEIRAELAVMVETAPRGEDGLPLPSALREGAMRAAAMFETALDEESLNFSNYETLVTFMDLHYNLITAAEDGDLEAIEGIITSLWDVVQELERDTMTPEQRALEDARAALNEALEEGASAEEIERLTDQLMEALEDMMMEGMQGPEGEGLSPEQMENLEQMRDMMEALREAMEEMGMTPEEFAELMQQLSQGAQPPMPGQQGGPQMEAPEMLEQMLEQMRQMLEMMQKMAQYIEELTALIDEQQALRDETLAEGIRRDRGDARPDSAPDPEQFDERQEDLKYRLTDLIERMQEDGLPVGGMQVAEGEMGEAEEDLDRNRPGEAVPDMDEALEALRGSQQNMQQMMMMMPGGGNESGFGDQSSPADAIQSDQGMVIDEDGGLLGGRNLNEELGITPGDDDSAARDVRERLLELQRRQGGAAPNGYVDRLLNGPGSF